MWCCSTCPCPEPWLLRRFTVDSLISMIKQMCPLLLWVNIWWAAVCEECGTNPNKYHHSNTLALTKPINCMWLSSINIVLHKCHKDKIYQVNCGGSWKSHAAYQATMLNYHLHMSILDHILNSGLPAPFKLPVTSKAIQLRHKTCLWNFHVSQWCVNGCRLLSRQKRLHSRLDLAKVIQGSVNIIKSTTS